MHIRAPLLTPQTLPQPLPSEAAKPAGETSQHLQRQIAALNEQAKSASAGPASAVAVRNGQPDAARSRERGDDPSSVGESSVTSDEPPRGMSTAGGHFSARTQSRY
jgi:hypothetical protein